MISRIFNPINGAVPAQEAQLILDWINALLGTKFCTLMQLRNGTICCELQGMPFPDHIKLQQINFCNKNDERRFYKNFKLLKKAYEMALTKREMRLKEFLLVHHAEFMQMLRFLQELLMRYSCAEQRIRCARCIDFERVKQLSQRKLEQLGELNVCTLMKALLEILQQYGQQKAQQQQQQEQLALATFGWPQCCQNAEVQQKKQRAAQETPQPTTSRSAARRRLCEKMQVIGLVCKALRWSPTSRRNYVLPQRVLPLRQNLGADYYESLCNAWQQQLQRRHKRKKREDQQLTKDGPRK